MAGFHKLSVWQRLVLLPLFVLSVGFFCIGWWATSLAETYTSQLSSSGSDVYRALLCLSVVSVFFSLVCVWFLFGLSMTGSVFLYRASILAQLIMLAIVFVLIQYLQTQLDLSNMKGDNPLVHEQLDKFLHITMVIFGVEVACFAMAAPCVFCPLKSPRHRSAPTL
eukprot:gnl/Spiro4/15173_TR8169_c0_g1_i1.p1 gnl/Spiro4/15173_TR8169_c0_g1~~gnl/Spiro4/15173_TR8169_c0_g1_i1.p1  ORF type:complete len:166 (-),score=34.74 gnl/Spiro4/15173_TR8169_c0_g1_i1:113-610(-)